jgi:hypothetical protein
MKQASDVFMYIDVIHALTSCYYGAQKCICTIITALADLLSISVYSIAS